MSNTLDKQDVDTRHLKSGQIRLRFKLSESSYKCVRKALRLTDYKYDNVALDAVCMSYMAHFCGNNAAKPTAPSIGPKRFLFKLHPDQFEIVRMALNLAREGVKTDGHALTLICKWFIVSESDSYENFKKTNWPLDYSSLSHDGASKASSD